MEKEEDPLQFLKNILSEVETETKKQVGDDWALWAMHYDTWITMIGTVLEIIPQEKRLDSMLIFRLMELQKTLLWLEICALNGAYHQLIRELRFVLDSFAQAYYLDKNYDKMEEKISVVEKEGRQLFGRKLILKLGLTQQDEILTIYRTLSKYEHSSYEEMRSAILEGKVDDRILFTFDKELFDKCKNFTNTVLDLVFYIVLSNFPVAISKLKDDGMTIHWLRKLDAKYTLMILGNQ